MNLLSKLHKVFLVGGIMRTGKLLMSLPHSWPREYLPGKAIGQAPPDTIPRVPNPPLFSDLVNLPGDLRGVAVPTPPTLATSSVIQPWHAPSEKHCFGICKSVAMVSRPAPVVTFVLAPIPDLRTNSVPA